MANARTDALVVAPQPELYQSVAVGAASASIANEIDDDTQVLWLYSDTDCHFRFGPVGDAAVATDTFLPASFMVLVRAKRGYVHVIQNTTGGTLHVSEMTY